MQINRKPNQTKIFERIHDRLIRYTYININISIFNLLSFRKIGVNLNVDGHIKMKIQII